MFLELSRSNTGFEGVGGRVGGRRAAPGARRSPHQFISYFPLLVVYSATSIPSSDHLQVIGICFCFAFWFTFVDYKGWRWCFQCCCIERCVPPKIACRTISLVVQDKYAEAGLLYEKLQAVLEKELGPDHFEVASTLNARAFSLQMQVGNGKESPLFAVAVVRVSTIGYGCRTLVLQHRLRSRRRQRAGRMDCCRRSVWFTCIRVIAHNVDGFVRYTDPLFSGHLYMLVRFSLVY